MNAINPSQFQKPTPVHFNAILHAAGRYVKQEMHKDDLLQSMDISGNQVKDAVVLLLLKNLLPPHVKQDFSEEAVQALMTKVKLDLDMKEIQSISAAAFIEERKLKVRALVAGIEQIIETHIPPAKKEQTVVPT